MFTCHGWLTLILHSINIDLNTHTLIFRFLWAWQPYKKTGKILDWVHIDGFINCLGLFVLEKEAANISTGV